MPKARVIFCDNCANNPNPPNLKQCSKCVAIAKHNNYLKNREKVLKRNKEFKRDNPKKVAEYRASYFKRHGYKEEYKQRRRIAESRYYLKNKDKLAERKRQYYKANSESLRTKRILYYLGIRIKNAVKSASGKEESRIFKMYEVYAQAARILNALKQEIKQQEKPWQQTTTQNEAG